jgi:hypothetical protein
MAEISLIDDQISIVGQALTKVPESVSKVCVCVCGSFFFVHFFFFLSCFCLVKPF